MNNDSSLKWLWDAVGPFIPPFLGGFIGLRYSPQASKKDLAVAWACSSLAGIYCGAAMGEFYGLGLKTTGAAMFLIAMFGSQLFAVAVAALKQWAADPAGTLRRYRNAVLGRSDEP
jgi:hypothetical protein